MKTYQDDDRWVTEEVAWHDEGWCEMNRPLKDFLSQMGKVADAILPEHRDSAEIKIEFEEFHWFLVVNYKRPATPEEIVKEQSERAARQAQRDAQDFKRYTELRQKFGGARHFEWKR